jgi:hypothetical protein
VYLTSCTGTLVLLFLSSSEEVSPGGQFCLQPDYGIAITHPLPIVRIQYDEACTFKDIYDRTVVTPQNLHIELVPGRFVHDGGGDLMLAEGKAWNLSPNYHKSQKRTRTRGLVQARFSSVTLQRFA